MSILEARFPRVCLARHLPTSGFRTLLPAYVFQNLPALFHAGTAHGVHLQGLSPSQSLRSLPEPVTFLTLGGSRIATSELEARPIQPSPTRLCSLRGFDTYREGVSLRRRPLPSWLFDLEGILPRNGPSLARRIPS